MSSRRKPAMKNRDVSWKDDKVRFKIYHQPDIPNPVFVSLNGENYTIELGEYVEAPRAILQVLVDAKIETEEWVEKSNDPGKFDKRPVTIERFHIQVDPSALTSKPVNREEKKAA